MVGKLGFLLRNLILLDFSLQYWLSYEAAPYMLLPPTGIAVSEVAAAYDDVAQAFTWDIIWFSMNSAERLKGLHKLIILKINFILFYKLRLNYNSYDIFT